MFTNDNRLLPKLFEASIDQALTFRDRLSPQLLDVLLRAWEEARDRHNGEVEKAHLLMALLKDPQVKAHLKLAKFDIDKIVSDVAYRLSRIEGRSGFLSSSGAAQGGETAWNGELKSFLNTCGSDAYNYGQPSVDVWMVFDHLQYDPDFISIFAVAHEPFAEDHDRRVRIVEENHNQVCRDIRTLAQDLQKLTQRVAELSQQVEAQRAVPDKMKRLGQAVRHHEMYFHFLKLERPELDLARIIDYERSQQVPAPDLRTGPVLSPVAEKPHKWRWVSLFRGGSARQPVPVGEVVAPRRANGTSAAPSTSRRTDGTQDGVVRDAPRANGLDRSPMT